MKNQSVTPEDVRRAAADHMATYDTTVASVGNRE